MSATEAPRPSAPAGPTPAASADPALLDELRELIVSSLNLQEPPPDAGAGTPLYGEGFGLDSIDVLEIALVVSKRYGLQLKADDQNNVQIFQSLGSLANYVAAKRTK
jgi:acyl carrier protein